MIDRRKALIMLGTTVLAPVMADAATFTGTGVDDQGNTITFIQETITPATFYVAANGSDANNGKSPSTPFQTIAKINALTLARGGSVLFNCGDTFVGNLRPNIDGNGDPANPTTIGSYGTGRATLVAGASTITFDHGSSAVINMDGMSGWIIQDLNLRGGDLAHMPMAGVRVANTSQAPRSGGMIRRCDISGIHYFEATAPSLPNNQGNNGYGIFMQGNPSAGFSGLEIFDCQIHDCDVGTGGFGSGVGNPVNFANVHIKNCTAYDIKGGPAGIAPGLAYPPMGNGFSLDSVNGGLIEFCTARDCGANYRNQGGGPAGFLLANCINVRISRCKAQDIKPSDFALEMVDFLGFDIDNANTGCVIDSCYATGCYNSGFLLFNSDTPFATGNAGWNDNAITNCISENNCRAGMTGFGEISVSLPAGGTPKVTVQNNTSYNNRVFNGDPYVGSGNKSAPGLTMANVGTPSGTISKNIHITNIDIYGFATLLNSRNFQATFNPPIDISNNAWFPQSGSPLVWWASTMYTDFAQWQLASGKGAGTQFGDPHFTAVGQGAAGYVQTTYPGWGATPQPSYGSGL
jgi:hypothetical protein